MSTVKGSKQDRLVVIPYRPWQKVIFNALVLLVFVLCTLISYEWGYVNGGKFHSNAVDERDDLQKQLADNVQQLVKLQQQVAGLERGGMVDQRANKEALTTIKSLEDEVFNLRKEIKLYKEYMSPGNGDKGLIISDLIIERSAETRRYKYKLVLRQIIENNPLLKGTANIQVAGTQGDQEVVYPLKDLSEDVDTLNIKLGFRFFQDIKGELLLPDGFEPKEVRITVKSSGRRSKRVAKNFKWPI